MNRPILKYHRTFVQVVTLCPSVSVEIAEILKFQTKHVFLFFVIFYIAILVAFIDILGACFHFLLI